MIPLPQIIAELVMALGGALLVANVVALVRARAETGEKRPGERRVTARGRAVVNVLIGLLVLAWGFASLVSERAA